MYYLGAMVAATGVYFAFQSCSKRKNNKQTLPEVIADSAVVSYGDPSKPLSYVEFYPYLQRVIQFFNDTSEGYQLSISFDDLRNYLGAAPLNGLYDPRFNQQALYNALHANNLSEEFNKHIAALNTAGLNHHAEILHNMIHLGSIIYQVNQNAESVAELLSPLFLPILGIKKPILLTDYLSANHCIAMLVTSEKFREPYTQVVSASKLGW